MSSNVKNQALVASRIKQLRRSRGLTQKEFAESLGIVQGYLSGIERGKKVPSFTLMMALCHVYQVTEEWLFSEESVEVPDQKSYAKARTSAGRATRIPLYRALPQDFPQSGPPEEFISLPGAQEGTFAMVVEGDYMAPTILNGDIAVIQPGDATENRSIVLMTNRWGEKILRRCRHKGEDVLFSSESPMYAPFKADLETRIFGRVATIWRNIRI